MNVEKTQIVANPPNPILDRISSGILWLLLAGSILIFDPSLRFACREAKDLYQLPLVALFIGLRLWSTSTDRPLGLRFQKTEIFALTILLFTTISFLNINSTWNGLSKYLNILLYLLFFFSLRDFLERQEKPSRILDPLITGGVVASIYAVFQFAGIDPFFEPVRKFSEMRWVVAGFTGQQTLFAGVIGPLIPCAFALSAKSRSRSKFIFYFISGLLLLNAVVLTHTRAILLGLIVASLCAAAILIYKSERRLFNRMCLLVLVLTILCSIAIAMFPTLKNRLEEGITLKSTSIKARFHYWQASMILVEQKPWFGWGLDSFPRVYPDAQIKIRKESLDSLHWGHEIVMHPHNEYLLIWIEGGIFLLISFLAFGLDIMKTGIRNLFENSNRWIISLGVLSGMVVILCDAFFSFPFHIGSSGLIAVVLGAFLSRRPKHETNQRL